MKEQPYFNPGPNTRYVNGKAIPAGETAMVPAQSKPDKRPEPGPPPDPDQVTADELAEASVAEVRESVAARTVDGAPIVSDAALAMLQAAEQGAEKPRKGVLQAIDEEQIRRAADRANDHPDGG